VNAQAFTATAKRYHSAIPEVGRRLIEPFVGAGAVFAGSDFQTYLLADVNQDLVNLYRCLGDDCAGLLVRCRKARPQNYWDASKALPRSYRIRRIPTLSDPPAGSTFTAGGRSFLPCCWPSPRAHLPAHRSG